MAPTEGRVARPELRWGCRRGTPLTGMLTALHWLQFSEDCSTSHTMSIYWLQYFENRTHSRTSHQIPELQCRKSDFTDLGKCGIKDLTRLAILIIENNTTTSYTNGHQYNGEQHSLVQPIVV